MKYTQRGKKELKRLANKLSALLEKGLDKKNARVRQIIEEIRFLITKAGFRKRFVRRAFGTALAILGLGFTQNVHAQAAFSAPTINPFGLVSTNSYAAPAAADFDNDGDLDLLVEEGNGVFKYFQNTGTATSPAFAAPTTNPFGLTASMCVYPEIAVVDLDNDGDFDIISTEINFATYNVDIKYYQNTGTAAAPAFAAPTTNPFGLAPSLYYNAPQLVDIDNDGDFDLISVAYNGTTYAPEMRYQQNTGTATAPAFAAPIINPFGLLVPSASNYNGYLSFEDLDNDGDFDALFGDGFNNGNFSYMENTGSATAPAFATALTNPFGLIATNAASPNTKINNPVFVDLDNDGDLDILTGEYYGNLVYFQNSIISSGPLSLINLNINSPSCSPGGDGGITVVAGGGMGPITYKIGIDSNTTGSFTNYGVGTYTLRVRDSVNTIIDSVFTINAPSAPVFDSTGSFISNISCNGANDGVIFISTTNSGTQPFMYQLLPSFPTSTNNPGFPNLSPNTYTAIITDANNCVDSANIVITEPPLLNTSVTSSTNVNCFGGNNGQLCVNTTGGTPGYTYTTAPAVGQSSPGCFQNLTANSYTITTTDANGCSTNVVQTITQPLAIILNVSSVQKASSSTAIDGSITSSASGGTGAIVYSIAPNMGIQSPPGTFTGLGANTYTITATDANNCTVTTAATVDAEWPIGVNDIEKRNIKIYPNPVADLVKIESDIQITTLTVLDVTGKSVLELNQPEESVSLSSLPTGVYVLKLLLKNEDTVYTRITKQ